MLRQFIRDQAGAAALEYAATLALIAGAGFIGYQLLGEAASNALVDVATSVLDAGT